MCLKHTSPQSALQLRHCGRPWAGDHNPACGVGLRLMYLSTLRLNPPCSWGTVAALGRGRGAGVPRLHLAPIRLAAGALWPPWGRRAGKGRSTVKGEALLPSESGGRASCWLVRSRWRVTFLGSACEKPVHRSPRRPLRSLRRQPSSTPPNRPSISCGKSQGSPHPCTPRCRLPGLSGCCTQRVLHGPCYPEPWGQTRNEVQGTRTRRLKRWLPSMPQAPNREDPHTRDGC